MNAQNKKNFFIFENFVIKQNLPPTNICTLLILSPLTFFTWPSISPRPLVLPLNYSSLKLHTYANAQ